MSVDHEYELSREQSKQKKGEDYFHYSGPVSSSENNSRSSSRCNSKNSSNKATPILKSSDHDEKSFSSNKIEFLPCKKSKSNDSGIVKRTICYEDSKLFGQFVINKNGSFQLPRSPMPKNILQDDEEEDDSEEDDEERSIYEEEDDDEDYETESNGNKDENLLRTESTKSLVKVNPMLFNSEFPHKPPTETNFQLGCKQKFKETDIKHVHLPRTPFPKNQKIKSNDIAVSEAAFDTNVATNGMHLDLTGSTMLNRRRTSSVAQPPIISILKPTK